MGRTERIAVFSFRLLHHGFESAPLARFKATREAIHKHFHGDLLESTRQDVTLDELDEHGCYHRRATGWGELN